MRIQIDREAFDARVAADINSLNESIRNSSENGTFVSIIVKPNALSSEGMYKFQAVCFPTGYVSKSSK